MALDQIDRLYICSDLENLCRYEMEEAISGRQAERDLFIWGSPIWSAYRAREDAERRLMILPELVKDQQWHGNYEAMRIYIKKLDRYIAQHESDSEIS